MLVAAAVWALGTQQMRRTRIVAPTLAIVFWMTLLDDAGDDRWRRSLFERDRWAVPDPATLAAIAYNAVLIFGLAQPVWLILARNLPPIASSMSVMLIPVLGTVSGAWWLGEALHWQDGAAIVLVLVGDRLGDVAGARRPLSARRDRRSRGRPGSRSRALPSRFASASRSWSKPCACSAPWTSRCA